MCDSVTDVSSVAAVPYPYLLLFQAVVVQGCFRAQIAEYLKDTFGVPPAMITQVKLKGGKK